MYSGKLSNQIISSLPRYSTQNRASRWTTLPHCRSLPPTYSRSRFHTPHNLSIRIRIPLCHAHHHARRQHRLAVRLSLTTVTEQLKDLTTIPSEWQPSLHKLKANTTDMQRMEQLARPYRAPPWTCNQPPRFHFHKMNFPTARGHTALHQLVWLLLPPVVHRWVREGLDRVIQPSSTMVPRCSLSY
jgi:hypothetical protein